MTEASGLTASLASATELKTGSPKCSLPPFPGDTPPTMLVPYSIAYKQGGFKKTGPKKKPPKKTLKSMHGKDVGDVG